MKNLQYRLLLLLFIWFPIQDTILSLAYRIYPSSYWIYGLYFKDFLVVSILILSAGKNLINSRFPFNWGDLLGVFYIVFNGIYVFFNPNNISFSLRLTTFRQLILPVILYFAGRYILISYAGLSRLFKIIIIIGLISAVFGFVETLVPLKYTWNGIFDLGGYLNNIKGFTRELPQNVPLNFWGYLGRRLAGLSASPLTQGYFLEFILFLLISSWIYRYQKKIAMIVIILAAQILTITRASLITTILVLPLFILFNPNKAYIKKVMLFYLFMMILILPFINEVLDLGEKTITMGESSSSRHLMAFKYSLNNLEKVLLIGQGFGTAGGWITSLGGEILGAWENAYFVIAYQIGIPGLILFLSWWFILLRLTFKAGIRETDSLRRTIFSAVGLGGIAFFITGFVSEQIMTFSSLAHFWIFLGISINLSSRKESDDKDSHESEEYEQQ